MRHMMYSVCPSAHGPEQLTVKISFITMIRVTMATSVTYSQIHINPGRHRVGIFIQKRNLKLREVERFA